MDIHHLTGMLLLSRVELVEGVSKGKLMVLEPPPPVNIFMVEIGEILVGNQKTDFEHLLPYPTLSDKKMSDKSDEILWK